MTPATTQYFRKKPVVIEARQFVSAVDFDEIIAWCGGRSTSYESTNGLTYPAIIIPTLEGDHLAIPGDWIIKGIKGEFYPCKSDIFEATYEAVESSEATPVVPALASAPSLPPTPAPIPTDSLSWVKYLENLTALSHEGRIALIAITAQVRSEDDSQLFTSNRVGGQYEERGKNDYFFVGAFFDLVAGISQALCQEYKKEGAEGAKEAANADLKPSEAKNE